MAELMQHDAIVSSIVDLQSGIHLASASIDGTIIVWNVDQKTKQQIFKEDENIVSDNHKFFNPITLSLSEDKKKLLSVGIKGDLQLFEINFGKKEILSLLKSESLY